MFKSVYYILSKILNVKKYVDKNLDRIIKLAYEKDIR